MVIMVVCLQYMCVFNTVYMCVCGDLVVVCVCDDVGDDGGGGGVCVF